VLDWILAALAIGLFLLFMQLNGKKTTVSWIEYDRVLAYTVAEVLVVWLSVAAAGCEAVRIATWFTLPAGIMAAAPFLLVIMAGVEETEELLKETLPGWRKHRQRLAEQRVRDEAVVEADPETE
jgi:hypothetical protein